MTITQPGVGVQDSLQRTHFPVELQVLPFPDPLPEMSSFFLQLTPPPTGGGAFVVSISWGNYHGILLGLYFMGTPWLCCSFAMVIKPPESILCQPKLQISKEQASYLSLE